MIRPSPSRASAPTEQRDRGSSMLLAPIALLIVLMLGAVTLEVGAMHLRQRQLQDLATTIANDAATVGFDVEAFRSNGQVTISESSARQVLGPRIASSDLPGAEPARFAVRSGEVPLVEVGLSYTHEFVLGQLIWGTSIELNASGEAALVRPGEA